MRSSDLAGVALGSVLAAACAEPLPGGDLGARSPAADGDAGTPPVASGCLPFHSVPGVASVTGAVRSLPRPGGGALAVVDDAVAGGVDVPSLALSVPAGATLDDCLGSATLAPGGATPAMDPATLAPLSGVGAGGAPLIYYVDPTGSIGVAAQDPADGRFRPGHSLLWTSDHPPFGTAAVTDGASVYAIGCKSARFLDADCFVARAPAGSSGDESAYEYYVGGGRWSPRTDDAWPVTSGEGSLDVAWLPEQGRWLMAYVPPLGTTITLRSGLSPVGPWSAPVPVATCALTDADMFCAGVHLHPAVATPPGTVALSYVAASFSPDVASRRASRPDDWWPRIVALRVPRLP